MRSLSPKNCLHTLPERTLFTFLTRFFRDYPLPQAIDSHFKIVYSPEMKRCVTAMSKKNK